MAAKVASAISTFSDEVLDGCSHLAWIGDWPISLSSIQVTDWGGLLARSLMGLLTFRLVERDLWLGHADGLA